jgi:hypothetical protein
VSSGIWLYVIRWIGTEVSEKSAVSFFGVEKETATENEGTDVGREREENCGTLARIITGEEIIKGYRLPLTRCRPLSF